METRRTARAPLDAEQYVAHRGRLLRVDEEETRRRFTTVFGTMNDLSYLDHRPPMIKVASSGDLGWIAAEVELVAEARGRELRDRWAWIMAVQKENGRWKSAGNGANRGE